MKKISTTMNGTTTMTSGIKACRPQTLHHKHVKPMVRPLPTVADRPVKKLKPAEG
jgi:hypothetical protein